uniref:Uncharacterized protein n=1 Tax=Haptolina brevifila TaxID=156173 RepID=A0A7S2GGP7_9EUKA|mmetsp:Transcript_37521/g.75040  ORF Transcript_37521/g.75040 Transcript_37521/m.75040 type:complete len:148 (+) Transcript_37521:775-1218(+)
MPTLNALGLRVLSTVGAISASAYPVCHNRPSGEGWNAANTSAPSPKYSLGAKVSCPPNLRCVVTTWGSAAGGGTGAPIANIVSIESTIYLDAFAALHTDGSVSTWGRDSGTLPTTVTSPTSPVVSIASNWKACKLPQPHLTHRQPRD